MKITLETEAFSLTVEMEEDEYVNEVLADLQDWRLVSISHDPTPLPIPRFVLNPHLDADPRIFDL